MNDQLQWIQMLRKTLLATLCLSTMGFVGSALGSLTLSIGVVKTIVILAPPVTVFIACLCLIYTPVWITMVALLLSSKSRKVYAHPDQSRLRQNTGPVLPILDRNRHAAPAPSRETDAARYDVTEVAIYWALVTFLLVCEVLVIQRLHPRTFPVVQMYLIFTLELLFFFVRVGQIVVHWIKASRPLG